MTIENLQRADVHPLEEAEGYRALMAQAQYDVAKLAEKIGKSESYVCQRLKLCELVEVVKEAFLEGASRPAKGSFPVQSGRPRCRQYCAREAADYAVLW